MNSLMTRVISAVLASLLIIGIIYQFGATGGLILGFILVAIGIAEYGRLTLRMLNVTRIYEILFAIAGLALLSLVTWKVGQAAAWIALVAPLYFTAVMWSSRNRLPNPTIQSILTWSGCGFVYAVLFPSLTLQLLVLPQGLFWFAAVLLVVFVGDTMAYFGGRALGKRKLMPDVSPKKTIAGSVSGLLGSTISGTLVLSYLFPLYPLWHFVLLSFAAGIVAQTGDLFASLLKRVAGAKDSGRIMPGHGGVLDRLDGVYFSGPLFYAYAIFAQTFVL